MSGAERLYTFALRSLHPFFPLLARRDDKLARGLRGREDVLERMDDWEGAQRDPRRPLVWFHAPSVGEGLQARAVMEVLRRKRPEIQLAYTFFSPSAETFADSVPADFADYLPLDFPDQVGRALDLLRPSVLVFTKTEVWPNLSAEAEWRGIRLALLSATLPAGSSRLGRGARQLLAPAYGRLDRLAAISTEHAERYSELGVAPERRTVMGDARFDQVWVRACGVDRHSPLLRPLRDRHRLTLVAGSTWPADETRLLGIFAELRSRGIPLRLILVPHEPTPEHLSGSEARLEGLGISHVRLSRLDSRHPKEDVLLVDRVGVLGELYALADVAYVGGGWGSAGLHSVLEPAAFGIPVVFGPRHENAREADELIGSGGGYAADGTDALRERLTSWATDTAAREAAGDAARAYVRGELGAAERGAAVVEELLDGADGSVLPEV